MRKINISNNRGTSLHKKHRKRSVYEFMDDSESLSRIVEVDDVTSFGYRC